MVPGSTLRYGSSFWMETGTLRLLRMRPMAAVVIPLPTELTTPPVTKMYFIGPYIKGQRHREVPPTKHLSGEAVGVSTPVRRRYWRPSRSNRGAPGDCLRH